MKLDKAIELLTLDKACGENSTIKDFEGDPRDLKDAIQLGLEALKRAKAQRGPGGEIGALGLPGETE